MPDHSELVAWLRKEAENEEDKARSSRSESDDAWYGGRASAFLDVIELLEEEPR